MRLDKPIGIYLLLWPSICGVLIAGLNNSFSINSVLIVTFGAILVRTCGCVINDIFDYKIFLLLSFYKLRCTSYLTYHRRGKRQTDAFLRFQTYFRP